MISPASIFGITSEPEFRNAALEVFRYQAENVPVYRDFISHLKIRPEEVHDLHKIPFLPVELFKSHEIIAKNKKAEIVFESSSTTGTIPGRHFVANAHIYQQSFLNGFKTFYGEPSEFCFLALLPSYLERTGSSLIYMARELISLSGHADSGFYLNEHDKLITTLKKLVANKQKTILLGVSYALLDLAEQYRENLEGLIIMETGGMKGRRKEMVREDLHASLKKSFNLQEIHSEYGMTELLSQAYSQGNGIFMTPPWMKVLMRDSYDPFHILANGQTGSINIIDLANIYSCSFIATSDMGRSHPDGTFEVLGRIDNSDIRGCNLMIE